MRLAGLRCALERHVCAATGFRSDTRPVAAGPDVRLRWLPDEVCRARLAEIDMKACRLTNGGRPWVSSGASGPRWGPGL